jgi:hypothetical protein
MGYEKLEIIHAVNGRQLLAIRNKLQKYMNWWSNNPKIDGGSTEH